MANTYQTPKQKIATKRRDLEKKGTNLLKKAGYNAKGSKKTSKKS